MERYFRLLSISAGVVLTLGIFAFNLQNPVLLRSNTKTVPLVVAEISNVSVKHSAPGLNIANNGSVFISGAVVTAVAENSFNVKMSWVGADFFWTIKTTGNTKFLTNKGRLKVDDNLEIGDIVNVTGNVADEGGPVIIAKIVRGD